jgi:hypothetical protein
VRERVAIGDVHVLHVPTTSQFANIFTKGLPTSVFTEFRSSLNILPTDDQTAGVLGNRSPISPIPILLGFLAVAGYLPCGSRLDQVGISHKSVSIS